MCTCEVHAARGRVSRGLTVYSTKPLLILPIKKSRWKIHCTTVILNTIFSFIWIKTTGAKHNPCQPGHSKTLTLAFEKTIPFLSGFLYKTSLVQGPLKIWTEYFHLFHFMKLQHRAGFELACVPGPGSMGVLDSIVWYPLILAILLYNVVFHP